MVDDPYRELREAAETARRIAAHTPMVRHINVEITAILALLAERDDLRTNIGILHHDCADAIEHAKNWQARGEKAEAALRKSEERAGKLAGALTEAVATMALVENPNRVDPDYGSEISALGDRIGYGALMSSASASWRDANRVRGIPEGAEFVAGPCRITILDALKISRATLAKEANDG